MTELASLQLLDARHGVLLPVRVKPRGRSNAVEGVRNGALLVSVTAAPADGAANAAVIAVLSDYLSCARSTLSIARGHKARDKVVLIAAADIETVRARFHQMKL
jgi:uncharacterized protein YggU (UPF0235/DUF167 family)